MSEKKKIFLPIIVEGRYDKNTLLQIFDATVIELGGFSVFNNKERQLLIRRLGERGIILLTDSDGGGRQLRSFISGILPKDRLHHVYIPKIEGRERRKKGNAGSGYLGVEGMGREVLERILAPFVEDGGRDAKTQRKDEKMLTKVDFYLAGLSGGEGSSEKRAALAEHFSLPRDMTAAALIGALNLLVSREEYERALRELFGGGQ